MTTTSIPFLLEVAAVLAAFIHPNHIAYLCSWGLTHLPPTCNSKLFGYMRIRVNGYELSWFFVYSSRSWFSTSGFQQSSAISAALFLSPRLPADAARARL
ncbi:hypothetical protein DM784_08000 [Vibrio furnissii]|nr:hypothetical protein DM784_08000 [Vibrio furnissii]